MKRLLAETLSTWFSHQVINHVAFVNFLAGMPNDAYNNSQCPGGKVVGDFPGSPASMFLKSGDSERWVAIQECDITNLGTVLVTFHLMYFANKHKLES